MPNNVLHVRSTTGFYGAESVILNLMKVFSEYSHKTYLMIIESDDAASMQLSSKSKDLNLNYFRYISNKKFDFKLLRKLREIVESKEVDIIHTHDYKSLIHVNIALAFSKIKKVHHIHGALGNTINEKIYGMIESHFMMFSDLVITVSEEQKKKIESSIMKPKVIIQLDNGTEIVDIEKKFDQEEFKIIMIARFTDEKNHKRAVDIFAKAYEINNRFRLVLLGDGPLKNSIEFQANSLGLRNSVEFVGHTEKVRDWLSRCNLLLICSRTEGMPMSLLEAMSIGVPCISTPVGDIPKIINESKAGKLCKSDNEFIDALLEYSKSNQLLEIESTRAKKYIVEKLSVDAQARRVLQTYRKYLGVNYDINQA